MREKRYLALDIGGSKIEAAMVTDHGEIVSPVQRVSAVRGWPRDKLLKSMDTALAPFAGESVVGLGVGFPAQGDYNRGVPCEQGATYPEMNGFRLRDHLSEATGLRVAMTTDANLFALGVARFGEGRTFHDFIGLTVGSGIGVGVVLNGRLEQGDYGVPPEALHALLQSKRRGDHLGANFRGCYGCDGETLAARASAGDSAALLAFERIGSALAETIRCLLTTPYQLQAIILGGGITQSYQLFRRALEKELRDTDVVVQPTELAHPALAGAAAMFTRWQEQQS